jgi:flagellar biosynthesis/type III secretory pathway protein FliH
MAFTAAKLQLHEGIAAQGGVISADTRLRLVQAHQLIDQMMTDAQKNAQELINQAHQQAQRIMDEASARQDQFQFETQQRAQSLLEQINEEWRRVIQSLEPTAVAVARLAIEQVCAGSTLAEKVDAATRAAVRELPESPVRLRVSPGSGSLVDPALSNTMEVLEDPQLGVGCVRVEGEHGACEVNFDVAKTSVTNYLASWSTRAAELMQNNIAPTARGA